MTSPDRAAATRAPNAAAAAPLLALHRVSMRFVQRRDVVDRVLGRRAHAVNAVEQVDLTIAAGEVVGLVGESGSGKTTLGRIAAGLLAPTDGTRLWNGRSATTSADRLAVQMIFQDAFASLNPRLRVRELIGEAPRVHGLVDRDALDDFVAEQLRRVGLDPDHAARYPHQFSGGQRARIGIARALAVRPALLVCDESVAALDVSIQAQVLNLFMELRASLGLTYLFISHDLGVVRHIADRVLVMHRGRIVESGPVEQVFESPADPYTRSLIDALPRLGSRK